MTVIQQDQPFVLVKVTQQDVEPFVLGNEERRDVRAYLEYLRDQCALPGVPISVAGDIGSLYGIGEGRGQGNPERFLIEYALDVANGVTDRSGIKEAIRSRKATFEGNLTPEQQIALSEQGFELRKEQWRAFLTDVIEDRAEAAQRFQRRSETDLQKVWMLPSVVHTKNGIKVQPHYLIFGLDGFDTFVRMLLLDENFGGELCQCRLETCRRFFLMKKPETGRPMRFYCDPLHMKEKHAAESGRRARQSRARKARKAK